MAENNAGSPAWGPSGLDVYNRTYSRIKDDGTNEEWADTVTRVVDGNLGLVDPRFIAPGERDALLALIGNMDAIPAGRHLWLSGVEGKQFINNCWVSGWTDNVADHFCFTFDQLMQGGGVGANYSGIRAPINNLTRIQIVLDPGHKDYEACKPYLSDTHRAGGHLVGDTREAWVDTLRHVMEKTQEYRGEDMTSNIVMNLSNIRESGKPIHTFGGTSAGPVPLAKLLKGLEANLNSAWELGLLDGRMAMEIDHLIAECVVSGNVRRSARMSVMHWKDPNISWFLGCKSDWSQHWSTNISVAIDQEFLNGVEWGEPMATRVFDEVTERMLKNGEPGFWNIELSNEDEPNYVEATNPCGEITLPAWGVCNLGHINLDSFALRPPGDLLEAHALMARFLVRATFADIPSEAARAVQNRDRRIGVGHFGFHGFIAKQGVKFSEVSAYGVGASLQVMYETVRDAADQYAYQLRIPTPVKVTTVAPTGTIAKMPGRSEGIHPIFSPYFLRRIRFSTVDARQREQLDTYRVAGYTVEADLYSANTDVVTIPTREPLVGEIESLGIDSAVLEGAYDLSVEAQLQVQALYQQHYADNAVSFTVNVDPEKVDLNEFRATLIKYLPELKGTTVFPVKSRPQSPYEPISKADFEMYEFLMEDTGYDEECSTGSCPVK